ncbi:MAG: copper amine oxidase N-terminal domain-containing protein [Clostridia bacterium]|nr:copper amine oxidase N-terminal domain-containing protein [Clostridia bacterium]
MVKTKFKKVAAIGMCCALTISGSVFAMSNDKPVYQAVPIMAVETDYQELLELQSKIDQYVFVDHVQDIAQAGFKVTNTGPIGDYVEVGILPYSEKNANFLYELFGTEKLKVVEGVQAYPLPMPEIIPIMEKLKIGIQVNGEALQLDVEPIIENDRTLVPLRGVMEKLGAKVDWDEQQRLVEITTDELTIQLVVDEDTAKVIKKIDETSELRVETIKLDVPTRIVDSRIFIPGRFVAETLGAQVNWDESLRIVYIDSQTTPQTDIITYENKQYGFIFSLPESWQGYQIVMDKWEGKAIDENAKIVESGPLLMIRHPEWTAENVRQDIPIMIFTLGQWNAVQNHEFAVSAAPIGPSELGRNNQYVFALPARYNFAFPTGYEEVEDILNSDPLQPKNL